MEQEEEWEREGLLDPAWEKQQRKVKPDTKAILSFLSLFILKNEDSPPLFMWLLLLCNHRVKLGLIIEILVVVDKR